MYLIWQDNLVILFIFLCVWTQSKYRQQPHSFKYTSVTDSPGLLHAKFSNMIANEVGSPNVNQKICFSKCRERGMEEWERDNPVLKENVSKRKQAPLNSAFTQFLLFPDKHLIPFFNSVSFFKSLNNAHTSICPVIRCFYMKQSLKRSFLGGVLEGAHLHNMVHFWGLQKKESFF